MRPRILVVEDERGLALTLRDRLESQGYKVELASDGEQGLKQARVGGHELVILDLMLPKRDGLEVCAELRAAGSRVPILMLTARGGLADKVTGLKTGADDYLTKPFEMLELTARVEALLRRSRSSDGTGPESFSFDDVRVDFRKAEVVRGRSVVRMAAQEYRLLCHFIAHRGELLSRDELLDAVWGYDAAPVTRTVDVHVAWLRQKLEANPHHPRRFITVRRLGYKFVDGAEGGPRSHRAPP